jgi:DNA-binding transcriptional regulator YiaG
VTGEVTRYGVLWYPVAVARYQHRPDIAQLRRERGETTRDFGQHFGRSGRCIEDWEQGRSQPDKLCEALLDTLKAQLRHASEQPA